MREQETYHRRRPALCGRRYLGPGRTTVRERQDEMEGEDMYFGGLDENGDEGLGESKVPEVVGLELNVEAVLDN